MLHLQPVLALQVDLKKLQVLYRLLESDDISEVETPDDAIEKEVNRYLIETPLRCDESGNSCLEWWKQNVSCFPKVAELAKQYLCIPPTSVPAEQIFSTEGLVINKQKSSLKMQP